MIPRLEMNRIEVNASYPSQELSEALTTYDPNNQDQADLFLEHVDGRKSAGNYFTDEQGNVILDLHASQLGQPLGYNNWSQVLVSHFSFLA
jgi:4-aminobutyrate aminotransferase-like enzyme